MKRTSIGIIGTGMLGTAVGVRLINCGHDLFAYNRTLAKTADLESHGAVICDTPRDVAGHSDMIITVVTDAAAVREVSFGRNGICQGIRQGSIVADMSTIHPSDSQHMRSRFEDADTQMLEIPVMGGPNVAVTGDLLMMASGDRQTFDAVHEILQSIAGNVFYLGPSGTAHTVKLAMNLQIAMLALSLSEGITLVRGAGIDPESFLKILNSTYFKTGMSQNKAFKMIQGKFDPTFTLKNLKKDLHTINAASASFGVQLPMSALAEDVYAAALDAGLGDLDYTGILRHIQRIQS